jgi:hypothetical protein
MIENMKYIETIIENEDGTQTVEKIPCSNSSDIKTETGSVIKTDINEVVKNDKKSHIVPENKVKTSKFKVKPMFGKRT